MFPAFLVFLLAFGLIVLGASACRAFELHRDDILYGGESEVSETIPTGRQPPSIDDDPVLEEVDAEPHQASGVWGHVASGVSGVWGHSGVCVWGQCASGVRSCFLTQLRRLESGLVS